MAIDYQRLQMQFVLSNHMWRIDGELRLPEPEELEQVVDRAIQSLVGYEPPAQIEVGHLIIKKRTGGIHDVFLHFGEIGETDGKED